MVAYDTGPMLYGAHVSASGGITNAIDRAAALTCDALQIFTQSPRMWRPTVHPDDLLDAYATRAREAGIDYTLCHAIYFINLANPDQEITRRSRAALEATVAVAARIGADTCFHVGSHLGAGLDATLPHVREGIAGALELLGPDQWLLLENSAGAGDTIGRDLEQLARVIEVADHPRVGLCIDTCHIYVSGVDLCDDDQVDAFVGDIERTIGLDRLRALHVNDAAAALGSNRDRHANMLEGAMGEGMGVFLSHPALQHLPAILETPGPAGAGSDAEEVDRLRRVHRAGLATRGLV
jgi:deoxyribonuclease-4